MNVTTATRPGEMRGGFALLVDSWRLLRKLGIFWFAWLVAVAGVFVLLPLAALFAVLLFGAALHVGIPAFVALEAHARYAPDAAVGLFALVALLPLLHWFAQVSLAAQALVHHRLDRAESAAAANSPPALGALAVALRHALHGWRTALGLALPVWLVLVALFVYLYRLLGAEAWPGVLAFGVAVVFVEGYRIRRTFFAVRPLGLVAPKKRQTGAPWRMPRGLMWRLAVAEVGMLLTLAALVAGFIFALVLLLEINVSGPSVERLLVPGIVAGAVAVWVYALWRTLLAVVATRDPAVSGVRSIPLAKPRRTELKLESDSDLDSDSDSAELAGSEEPATHDPVYLRAQALRPAKRRWLTQAGVLFAANAVVYLPLYVLVVAPSVPTEEEVAKAEAALPHALDRPPTPAEADYYAFVEALREAQESWDELIRGPSLEGDAAERSPWRYDGVRVERFFARNPELIEAWDALTAHPLTESERNVRMPGEEKPIIHPRRVHNFIQAKVARLDDDPNEWIALIENISRLVLIKLRYGFLLEILSGYSMYIPTLHRLHEKLVLHHGKAMTREQWGMLDRIYRETLNALPPAEQHHANRAARDVHASRSACLRHLLTDWMVFREARRELRMLPRVLEEKQIPNWEFAERMRNDPDRYVRDLGTAGPYDFEYASRVKWAKLNVASLITFGRTATTSYRLLRLSCWIEAEHARSGERWLTPEQWRTWEDDPPLPGPLPSWRDDWCADGEAVGATAFEAPVTWRGPGRYRGMLDADAVEALGEVTLSVAWDDTPLDEALAAVSAALEERELTIAPQLASAFEREPETFRVTLTLDNASAAQVLEMLGQQLGLRTNETTVIPLFGRLDFSQLPHSPFEDGYRLHVDYGDWRARGGDSVELNIRHND